MKCMKHMAKSGKGRSAIMEQTMEPAAQTTPAEKAVETPAAPTGMPSAPTPPKTKKKRKKTVRRVIAAVLVAAIGFGFYRFKSGKNGGSTQIVTDVVQYGSITSVVEGSGMTKAKNSETITLTTAGTVLDVFVTEGEQVEAGEPLFTIDSPNAESEVKKAREQVDGYTKQISEKNKNLSSLNMTAPYTGKLIDTVKLTVGEEYAGGKVATLVDDTRMRLTEYYSYAYEKDFYVGQTVNVSVPSLMSNLTGTVEAIHKVSYITPEGSKLFSVDIVVDNPGVLAKDMAASATVTVNGETVYPYQMSDEKSTVGRFDYYRTSDLTVTGSGTVLYTGLLDYLSVTAGQQLLHIDAESSENELFDLQKNLEEAQKTLETAEKNLANCNAVAPISGMVIGLSINPGDEIASGTSIVSISDTSQVIVNATVDERNVSYLKKGMGVNLDQWGNSAYGEISSISLSSSVNNGVATYPFVITADNSEGMLQINSYINYNLTASQSDNCLVLPIQAVRTVGLEDGTSATVVYIKADSAPDDMIEVPYMDEEIPDGFYPVKVEIGIQDNYNVEIKSGVEEGTEVFTQIMSDQVSSW